MRLSYRPEFVSIGSVFINALSRVTELDSGLITGPSQYAHLPDGTITAGHSHETLQKIESQLAIVVPCMDEELPILRGVLSGIPHHSRIIVVSNSNASNFQAERNLISELSRFKPHQPILVHQTSVSLARAFSAAGMPQVLHAEISSPGRLRSGKGEAMMAGTALAKLSGADFVGFIDADNFVPGAVHEYCKVFTAGLFHAVNAPPFPSVHGNATDEQPLAMVRIKWKTKPKIVDGKLVHRDAGRCSRVVNKWMNRLLDGVASGSDDVSEFISTANAGEHAMSMELAMKLQFATGYAVEPYQLVDLLERSAPRRVLPTPPASPRLGMFSGSDEIRPVERSLLGRDVSIVQIETMNPHIHDFGKGDTHIAHMQAQGLGTVFHSQRIQPEVKKELQAYIEAELAMVVEDGGIPEEARVYPAMEDIDWERFRYAFGDLHSLE